MLSRRSETINKLQTKKIINKTSALGTITNANRKSKFNELKNISFELFLTHTPSTFLIIIYFFITYFNVDNTLITIHYYKNTRYFYILFFLFVFVLLYIILRRPLHRVNFLFIFFILEINFFFYFFLYFYY